MLTLHQCKYQGGEGKLLVLFSMGGKLIIAVLLHMWECQTIHFSSTLKIQRIQTLCGYYAITSPFYSRTLRAFWWQVQSTTAYNTVQYNITLLPFSKGPFWDNYKGIVITLIKLQASLKAKLKSFVTIYTLNVRRLNCSKVFSSFTESETAQEKKKNGS